jgi:hypothetical protein
MYCEERARPSLLFVDADTTNVTEVVGSGPFTITIGLLAGRPSRS